jgi:hypothetical protein
LSTRKVSIPLANRELLSTGAVAALFGKSRNTIGQWRALGLMPPPVEVRGTVAGYRARELRDWVAAGCPVASEWEWVPTVPVELRTYIAVLSRQAADLDTELRAAQARLDRGETFTHVRQK